MWGLGTRFGGRGAVVGQRFDVRLVSLAVWLASGLMWGSDSRCVMWESWCGVGYRFDAEHVDKRRRSLGAELAPGLKWDQDTRCVVWEPWCGVGYRSSLGSRRKCAM